MSDLKQGHILFGEDLGAIPNTLGEAALYYRHKLNLFVLPVDMINTNKRYGRYGDWQYESAVPLSDDELVFQVENKKGIGIRLPPGISVVDLDVNKTLEDEDPNKHVGFNSLMQLINISNAPDETLDTLTVNSGSGGSHLYYRSKFQKNNSGVVGPGIDIRSAVKGIVMVPPSYGKNLIGRYTFALSQPRVRDMPHFLAHKLAEKTLRQIQMMPDLKFADNPTVTDKTTKLGEAILKWCCASITQAAPGTRNDTIFVRACLIFESVNSGYIAPNDAITNLERAAMARTSKSGKSGNDLNATIRSARNRVGTNRLNRMNEDWLKQVSGFSPAGLTA